MKTARLLMIAAAAVTLMVGCSPYDDPAADPDLGVPVPCFPYTRADLDALVKAEDAAGNRCGMAGDDRMLCRIAGLAYAVLLDEVGEPVLVYAHTGDVPVCDDVSDHDGGE